MSDEIEVAVCPRCGMTMPAGKKVCWCCEHDPEYRAEAEAKEADCDENDFCEIRMK